MDRRTAARVLREAARRADRTSLLDSSRVLFGPQRAFCEDRSPFVAACCSRRAGKSYGIAWRLSRAALRHEGSIVPYITRTREDAKNIVWPALRDLDAAGKIGMRFKENDGTVVLPNRSKIILRGADSDMEIERLRGPKYPEAAIDEAQTFSRQALDRLVDDVLGPALLDYRGAILMTGTPNASRAGPFHDVAVGKSPGWSVHSWTLRDNPHLPDVEEWLARLKERKGWTDDHPTFLREYCGIWVRDGESLTFALDSRIVEIPAFDPGDADDWEYVLGVDLGFNDPTAFVVIAWSAQAARAVVLRSWKESGLTPSAFAVRVEELCGEFPFASIVADTGGFGKGYVEELREKHDVPVEAAKKGDKPAFVEMLNGDLRSGSLQIVSGSNRDLLAEMSQLQWDPDQRERGRLIFDRRFEDHLSDALVYGFRECHHREGEAVRHPPRPGSREALAREEDALEERLIRRLERGSDPWWDLDPLEDDRPW